MTRLGETFTYEQMLHLTGNFSEANLSNMATLETFPGVFGRLDSHSHQTSIFSLLLVMELEGVSNNRATAMALWQ